MSADAHTKMVGPVIRGIDSELAEAVAEAVEADNPDRDVFYDDRGGYVRISVPQRCRLTKVSLEETLGRPFQLVELEPSLSSFAGRMHTTEDEIVWFLDRED